jgi:hypothetical protein
MTRVAFTLKSRNAKTGNIPVSTSEASTCADDCPLKKNGGCYAKHGPLGMYWAKVNDGRAKAFTWAEFTAQVAALPDDQFWRHNQAGDLPGDGDAIDHVKLYSLVKANRGKRGFTYSHKPVIGDGPQVKLNREAIAVANREGFTINLSADTLTEADQLAALNIGPVVVVVARDAENHSTPEGRKVVICPAQTRDDVSCKTCGLCSHATRTSIVGFRAHGVSAKKAEAIALNK